MSIIGIVESLRLWALSLLTAAVTAGCAHVITVEVPPRIDLQGYGTIGIVDFSSHRDARLNIYVTQEFIKAAQGAQPRVRFLELGPADQVLASLGRDRVDPQTIIQLGKKYHVGSVFTGHYEITRNAPRFRIGGGLSSISASESVALSLSVKHWDTATGATLWTNSRRGEWSLAKIQKRAGLPVMLKINDAEDKYTDYLSELAFAVADDFRPHYVKRTVEEK